MYLLFIQLTLITYIILFIIQSISSNIFNKLIYLKLVKTIDDSYKNWISNNPNDEWISACAKGNVVRNNVTDVVDSDSSDDEIDKELQLGDASTIVTSSRLKDIFSLVWGENASTFQVTYKTIMLIVYVKLMIAYGHFNELLIGILIGSMYHLMDLLMRMIGKVKNTFLDEGGVVSIEKILTNPSKVSYKTLLIIPIIPLVLIYMTKASFYSRILGEWVIDISMVYLYIGQILGFTVIQTFINLIKTAKTQPMIVLLTLVYILIAMFI